MELIRHEGGILKGSPQFFKFDPLSAFITQNLLSQICFLGRLPSHAVWTSFMVGPGGDGHGEEAAAISVKVMSTMKLICNQESTVLGFPNIHFYPSPKHSILIVLK